MNKKKLLIYAHYYIPDTASTGQILRELAEGMLEYFDITVIYIVPSCLGGFTNRVRQLEEILRQYDKDRALDVDDKFIGRYHPQDG